MTRQKSFAVIRRLLVVASLIFVLGTVFLCRNDAQERLKRKWYKGYYMGACGNPLLYCPPGDPTLYDGWEKGEQDFLKFQDFWISCNSGNNGE